MTDIVDELRGMARIRISSGVYHDREKAWAETYEWRAADEIERLRDKIETIQIETGYHIDNVSEQFNQLLKRIKQLEKALDNQK